MNYVRKSLGALVLCVIVFLSIAVSVGAVAVDIAPRELSYFQGIRNKSVAAHPKISVSLGDRYISDSAYLINDTTYVPLRAATELAGADVGYDAQSRTAIVRMPGLEMTVSDGSYTAFANGRALLSKTPSQILSDGKMYVPVRVLAKALSLEVVWLPERSVKLSGVPTPLIPYDKYYRSDDLYWLSRIISAESRGESLLGQIAVGNVVLNRVRSSDFPNTVWGVIFDRKHGVQFSPVSNGSIYSAPSYTSVVAAKICLEGVSVSPDVIFFMEPSKSTSSWIYTNRKYAFTIGNHYFFY